MKLTSSFLLSSEIIIAQDASTKWIPDIINNTKVPMDTTMVEEVEVVEDMDVVADMGVEDDAPTSITLVLSNSLMEQRLKYIQHFILIKRYGIYYHNKNAIA